MVPEERLELSRIAPEDFKSSASASSATPAQARLLYNEGAGASSTGVLKRASPLLRKSAPYSDTGRELHQGRNGNEIMALRQTSVAKIPQVLYYIK